MIKDLNKKVKKMTVWDIALTKLAVAAAVLFVIGVWPAAMNWVLSVNAWWFLVAFIVFAARPWSKMLSK